MRVFLTVCSGNAMISGRGEKKVCPSVTDHKLDLTSYKHAADIPHVGVGVCQSSHGCLSCYRLIKTRMASLPVPTLSPLPLFYSGRMLVLTTELFLSCAQPAADG